MVNKKILEFPIVTGAMGYIGISMLKYLSELKEVKQIFAIDMPLTSSEVKIKKVKYIGLDLSAQDSINKLKKIKGTCVIALAALNGTSRFYSNPWTVYYNTIMPTINTIEAFAGKIPIVYSSSSETYSSSVNLSIAKLPTDESVPLTIEDVHNPRWSYAGAKTAGEIAMCSAAKEKGLSGTIIRYHNVYGPNMPPDHFIPDFLNRIKNKEYSIYGSNNTRSFLYIDDAIEGTILSLSKASTDMPIYHLGSQEEMSIFDAATKIMSLMKIDEPLTIYPAPEGSVIRRVPDCSKIKKDLGWFSKVSFEEGILKILNDKI